MIEPTSREFAALGWLAKEFDRRRKADPAWFPNDVDWMGGWRQALTETEANVAVAQEMRERNIGPERRRLQTVPDEGDSQ
jgi:hypothetical protein